MIDHLDDLSAALTRLNPGDRVACIGSRELTAAGLHLCRTAGRMLALNGFRVVSGGAPGADQAFVAGCHLAGLCATAEVYLPWESYEAENRPHGRADVTYRTVGPAVRLPSILELAALHPAWDRLGRPARLLMIRNAVIVRTSVLVVALPRLTRAGRWTGGTAHGLTVAQHLGLPIVDLNVGRDPDALCRRDRPAQPRRPADRADGPRLPPHAPPQDEW